MSYDIFLKPRLGLLGRESFATHFREQPYFTVDSEGSWYRNKLTGTYFSFLWRDVEKLREESLADDPDDLDPAMDFPVHFNLNYFRPSTFGLEAAPHLARLVEAFDLVVYDPQAKGMGSGEFSVDRFLAAWNHGNASAVEVMLKEQDLDNDYGLLPREQLHRSWAWNLEKSSRAQTLIERGIDRHLASHFFARIDGQVCTFVVWPDGISFESLPADFVLVGRKKLAPWNFLRRNPDRIWLPWCEVERVITPWSKRDSAGVVAVVYDSPPREISRFIKSLETSPREVTLLPLDQVMDEELSPLE